MSTMELEKIFSSPPSSSWTQAVSTPKPSSLRAFSRPMTSPASARISPVRGSATGRARVRPLRRAEMASFLLYLYRPTLERSYRRGSKRSCTRCLTAESMVGGSPGRSLR